MGKGVIRLVRLEPEPGSDVVHKGHNAKVSTFMFEIKFEFCYELQESAHCRGRDSALVITERRRRQNGFSFFILMILLD